MTCRKLFWGLEARVRDRRFDEQPSTWGVWFRIETEWFIWLNWIHISFFQQLLVKSISSVVWQTVSKSGEKLKAKGKKNALNKSSQNNHVGTFRIAHKETYSVNNPCHSFPCSSLNSASLLVCVSQILLWVKSEFRKWSFSVWHITQTCLSQICFRELMKVDIEGEMVWNGKTWKIFLSDLSSLLHC